MARTVISAFLMHHPGQQIKSLQKCSGHFIKMLEITLKSRICLHFKGYVWYAMQPYIHIVSVHCIPNILFREIHKKMTVRKIEAPGHINLPVGKLVFVSSTIRASGLENFYFNRRSNGVTQISRSRGQGIFLFNGFGSYIFCY